MNLPALLAHALWRGVRISRFWLAIAGLFAVGALPASAAESLTIAAFARYLPAGRGRLVLAWPSGRTLAKAEDLVDPKFARIALPDERQAVYGKAASQFLARSALAQRLEGRLLMVANVPQVSAYLVSGEVDAGFVNLTDALGVRGRIGGFLEIDPALYDEVRIVAGVVEGRETLPGVEALAEFLATPEARTILTKHGL